MVTCDLKYLTDAIVKLDVKNIGNLVHEAIAAGTRPLEILKALNMGMEEVGQRFQKNEYYLADLIMAGETMNEALKVLAPYLKVEKGKIKGKVVLGTIEGDLHDIGKNIVKTMLSSAGFEIYDLGIDVPPKKFAEKAKEVGASVIGVSALLSTSVPTTAKVVEELTKSGIRTKVKVIIGGGAVRKWNIEKFGVDDAVNDVVEGVKIIRSWMED